MGKGIQQMSKEHNRQEIFTKKKKCSTSVAIQEKQVKATMRHVPSPVKKGIIQENRIANSGKDVEKENPYKLNRNVN